MEDYHGLIGIGRVYQRLSFRDFDMPALWDLDSAREVSALHGRVG